MSQTGTPPVTLDTLDRLETLRDPAKSSPENRAFKRFVIRADAELHPMSRSTLDSTPVEIRLRDISRIGLGFVADQPLKIGTYWRCCFLERGYAVGEVACQVRHTQKAGDHCYLIGAQIVLPTGLMHQLGVNAADLSLTPPPRDAPAQPLDETYLQPHEVDGTG